MERDDEWLAKQAMVEKFKDAAGSPALAAEIAHKVVVSGLADTQGPHEPREIVAAACRGVMVGMLLLDKELQKTAVSVLAEMALVSQEADLDPADCMTWAMEGIASVVKLAPVGAADAVGAAIEESFMGAGAVFENILRTVGA